MANLVDDYENIARAVIEISYDNGGINRNRSERKLLNELENFLRNYDLEDLHIVNNWLGTLSDWEFSTVCTGEYEMQQEISSSGPFIVNDILDELFENVC